MCSVSLNVAVAFRCQLPQLQLLSVATYCCGASLQLADIVYNTWFCTSLFSSLSFMSSALMLCTGMYFEFERSCFLRAVPPRFAGSAHLSGFLYSVVIGLWFYDGHVPREL